MSLFSFGTNTIPETIKAVSDLYTTDKARLEGEKNLMSEVNRGVEYQSRVNAILAASTNIFAIGWIPLLGWTCGFLVLLYWGPQLVIANYIWAKLCIASGKVSSFPIKPDDINNLLWLLFGYGGYSIIKHKIT